MKPFSYWIIKDFLPEDEFKKLRSLIYDKFNLEHSSNTHQEAGWLENPEALKLIMGPLFRGRLEETVGKKLIINREVFPSLRRRIGPNPGMLPHTDYEGIEGKYACTYYLNDLPAGEGTIKFWEKVSEKKLSLHEKADIYANQLVLVEASNNSYHSVDSLSNNLTRDTLVIGWQTKK